MLSKAKDLQKEAMQMLKDTSRTFYIPISLLKPALKKTVASGYLCMRAIDEIEDHETLDSGTKQSLLRSTGRLLESGFDNDAYNRLMDPYRSVLPEVTLRMGDWLGFCPSEIVGKIKESTSEMAFGMADWAEKNWHVRDKEDLENYTYYVAGLVGVMLSDIWQWYDGTTTDRELAIAFGRGLQTVNILRNQDEDRDRGVKFIPDGWTREDLFAYTEENLALADKYMKDIHTRNILLFCKIPLALANRTLKALKSGKEKMSRAEVEEVVAQLKNE